jgi:hypothetical protein
VNTQRNQGKKTMSLKSDEWYDGIVSLLRIIHETTPNIPEIRRALLLLETMDSTLVRRATYSEACNHYGSLRVIIEARSLESATKYLDSNGCGSYVEKYYSTVMHCIENLPPDVEEECWQRLASINALCAQSTPRTPTPAPPPN